MTDTIRVQIVLLALLVLREPIAISGWLGIALVVIGTLAVQALR